MTRPKVNLHWLYGSLIVLAIIGVPIVLWAEW